MTPAAISPPDVAPANPVPASDTGSARSEQPVEGEPPKQFTDVLAAQRSVRSGARVPAHSGAAAPGSTRPRRSTSDSAATPGAPGPQPDAPLSVPIDAQARPPAGAPATTAAETGTAGSADDTTSSAAGTGSVLPVAADVSGLTTPTGPTAKATDLNDAARPPSPATGDEAISSPSPVEGEVTSGTSGISDTPGSAGAIALPAPVVRPSYGTEQTAGSAAPLLTTQARLSLGTRPPAHTEQLRPSGTLADASSSEAVPLREPGPIVAAVNAAAAGPDPSVRNAGPSTQASVSDAIGQEPGAGVSLDTQGFAASISQVLQSGNGDYSVLLRLHPPELGQVQARLSLRGDMLQVELSPEHAAAHDALQNAMPSLREHLSQGGAEVDVSLGDPSSQQHDVPAEGSHWTRPGGDSETPDQSVAVAPVAATPVHGDSDRLHLVL